MARYLSFLYLSGLALANINDFEHGPLTKRQDPPGYTPPVSTTTTTAIVSTITPVACASPGINFLVNSDFVTPDSPGSVNYTVQCGSNNQDTFGTNLYDGGQEAPNGYLDCISICEASPNCQAFQFVAGRADGTGTSPGNCYLKRTSCEQGVAFDRRGQNSAAYVAGLRPGPAAGTGTTTSPSAAQPTRACAASATPTNSPSNSTNVYYVQCDIDTEGGLLSVIGSQADYNACFPLCDSTPGCVGFTFTQFEGSGCPGYCYLKFSDPPSRGLRFTNLGLQGTNLIAALMSAQYLPPVVSSTVTATSTPGPPPAYTPPAVTTTTTTTTSTTSSITSSLVPTSSLCPGGNGTIVTDINDNTYTLYCGYEYQGEADLLDNAPSMQACIDACGARPASPAPGNCLGVSYTGGNAGPGSCYLKTTGLYLTPAPDIICAVRNVVPPPFSSTVTSTSVSSTTSTALEPPAYTPPIVSTTTTTSSSSSEQEPPIEPTTTTTITTSSSSFYSATSTSSSSSEAPLNPPIYTPPVVVTISTSSSSELSSSETSLSPPIYTPPVVATTSTSSSFELTTSSSSSDIRPSSSSSEIILSSSSSGLESISSVEITTTLGSSSSSSEVSFFTSSSSSESPPSPPAYTAPSSSESSTQASSATSSAVISSSSSVPPPPAYETTIPTTLVISSSSSSASQEVTFTVTPVPSPTTSTRVPPQVTDIPSCAQPCILDLGNCAVGDVRCICSNQPLLETYRQCVVRVCTPTEAAEVVDYANDLCGDYGITALPSLNYPLSTSTTAPPTSITSRPPSVTDIPPCAQRCVLGYGDCSETDVRCICSNTPLLEQYRTCIVQSCNATDAKACYDYAAQLCGGFGVTSLLPLYPSSTVRSSSPPTGPASVTTFPATPGQQSCIPCTRSTGSCVKRTTVIPVYSREL
ncbi:Putative extracellular membrane protein, CFEM [Septoria linicola]|uniref:Extracellular membrane protein, CFEM n=1 Tax=Septoria linicola TaxID=215465 RepID=A0A9Q9EIN5_9PEZI|nr:putative extracellular membrane protein, CFEM [Septoria linicola]USW51227.1 Putative extracellular membrane protein, CFEM [Septoria linicola]